MIVLRLDKITFSHPDGLLLEDMSWAIQDGEKIGLVGPNGSGKSTILKLLTGKLVPDSGHIFTARGVTVGYLPQEVTFDLPQTVLAEALTASEKIAALEAELQAVETSLAEAAVYNDETALTRTLDRQARLLDAYAEAGGQTLYTSETGAVFVRIDAAGVDVETFLTPSR